MSFTLALSRGVEGEKEKEKSLKEVYSF